MQPSKYHFELWSPDGKFLADLTGRAKNRRIVQSRNEPEEIYWQIGMRELDEAARRLHMHPNELLVTNQTEVRIRRGRNYLCGGQLIYRYPRLTRDTQDVELRATGFLNLFSKRYTPDLKYFPPGTEATLIPAELITESQLLPNGDFGVTIGSLAVVGEHEKTFKAVQIKEAIQRTAELFNFDFEFTHDKVFNTYAALGSNRPEIVFEYPGNIIELGAPEDGTNVVNEITVLGSGSGDEGNVKAARMDEDSQVNYKLRQERISYSEVESVPDLERHGDAYLDTYSRPFEIPDLTVDGNVAPFVTDYNIGDYVNVRCREFRLLEHLHGLYRVEKRTIAIDENDNEEVTLEVSR